MRMTHFGVLLLVGIIIACDQSAYVQPPAGSFETARAQLRSADTLVPVRAAFVTSDFFRSTKAHPLLGRLFIDGDQSSSPTRAIVLSQGLWTSRFDSVPAVIGRTLELDGSAATIVGVATADFDLPAGTEIWILNSTNLQK